jgi:hypothetical protein
MIKRGLLKVGSLFTLVMISPTAVLTEVKQRMRFNIKQLESY